MRDNTISLMDVDEVFKEVGVNRHVIKFTSSVKIDDQCPSIRTLEKLYSLLREKLAVWDVNLVDNQSIEIESVSVKVETENNEKKILVSWNNQDEDLGSYVLGVIQNLGA